MDEYLLLVVVAVDLFLLESLGERLEREEDRDRVDLDLYELELLLFGDNSLLLRWLEAEALVFSCLDEEDVEDLVTGRHEDWMDLVGDAVAGDLERS